MEVISNQQNTSAPFDLLGAAQKAAPIVDAGSSIISAIGGLFNADRNYANQVAQQDYMKHMQQVAWQREDNAVQRRVADLKAAGLSPILAAGSAASAGPVAQINTPQRQFTPVDTNAVGMMGQMSQIAQSQAQAKLTEIEAEKKAFALDYFKKAGIPEEGMDIWGKRFSELTQGLPSVNKKVVDFATEQNEKHPFLKWLDDLTGASKLK